MPATKPFPKDSPKPDPEIYQRRVATKVRTWRAEQQLTQEAVAAQCGFTSMTLKRLEACKVIPDLKTLVLLGHAMGITPSDLLLP